MGISEDHDPATDSRIDNGDTIVSGTTPLFGKVKLSGLETSGTTTYEYSNYAIDANGTITASVTTTTGGSSTTSMQNVGRLVLATFNNTAGLEKAGYSNYKESLNSGKATYDFANDGAAAALRAERLKCQTSTLQTSLQA
jgi:flagellar hook protein FlgE